MHFLSYTPLVFLLSFFQSTVAHPVHNNNDYSDSNPAIWSSSETISGWRFFSVISFWTGHGDGGSQREHKPSIPVRQQTINMPPQHNPASIPEPYYDTIPESKYDNLYLSPATQGMFNSLGDLDRVLAPVGLLVAMVWLAFLAGGLVAIVDYVWVKWGRDYSGYSSSLGDANDEGEEEKKVEEGEGLNKVKLEVGGIGGEDELDKVN